MQNDSKGAQNGVFWDNPFVRIDSDNTHCNIVSTPHLHTSTPNFTPPTTQLKRGPVRLDIVTGGRCPICAASRPLVEQLMRDLPGVNIRLIDIDVPGTQIPRNIVAIPTFIVNGYVVATGNPDMDDLKQFIRSLQN